MSLHRLVRLIHPLGSPLALIALAIAIFGVVMILSASGTIAMRYDLSPAAFGIRQSVYLVLGLIAFVLMAQLPTELLRRLRWLLMLAAILVLVLVLIPSIGVEVNGARSWLDLGIAHFQPVEFTKLILVIYIAGQLHHNLPIRTRFFDTIPLWALTGIAALLVIIQPDFSGSLILILICGGMLFIAGLAWRAVLTFIGLGVLALPVVIYMAPYRLQRIVTALDPWADPTGSGYQMANAMIAIGRGNWLGSGLGKSVQKYLYLPEAHTDFLLAITIEELGLISLFVLLAFYLLLLGHIVRIATRCWRAQNRFGYLVCWGVFWMLASQSAIAIGVNLAILPTTGLPLPFFSFGGSSLLAGFLALGLVTACARSCTAAQRIRSPVSSTPSIPEQA